MRISRQRKSESATLALACQIGNKYFLTNRLEHDPLRVLQALFNQKYRPEPDLTYLIRKIKIYIYSFKL